ncbi:MAG: hypothetical protein JST11_17640 [Acidobacteria bacterium]|nr:hypothetical protein [Acidobacteriota bacterium]
MRLALLLVASATLYGQAAVEAGLGAARAVTSTAPARDLGKGIAGAFSNLDKALGGKVSTGGAGAAATSTETVLVRSHAAAESKEPARTYETIAHAEVGMAYDDLVRRFGPPSLELAAGEGVSKLTYSGKEGPTQIEVKEGKVASIKAAGPAKTQPGVLVLPGAARQ